MSIGKIARLKTETSTGFIREEGCPEEIFFQSGALVDATFNRLREGQAVEFDHQPYSNAPDKTRAVNVRVLGQGTDVES